MQKKTPLKTSFLLRFFTMCFCLTAARAEPMISEIKELQVTKIENLSQNQGVIEQLSVEIDQSLLQHESNLKEIDALKIYNNLLEDQVVEQRKQILSTDNALKNIAGLDRKIMPLFVEMINGLTQIIDKDLPFLQSERKKRVASLALLVRNPEITIGEKYYKILEAYQVENGYGKTFETYKKMIVVNEEKQQVDILRVGRIGLFFLNHSKTASGVWDRKVNSWIEVDRALFKKNIRKAIDIAKELEQPDLVILPFQVEPSVVARPK